jgi:hypothetical protein
MTLEYIIRYRAAFDPSRDIQYGPITRSQCILMISCKRLLKFNEGPAQLKGDSGSRKFSDLETVTLALKEESEGFRNLFRLFL